MASQTEKEECVSLLRNFTRILISRHGSATQAFHDFNTAGLPYISDTVFADSVKNDYSGDIDKLLHAIETQCRTDYGKTSQMLLVQKFEALDKWFQPRPEDDEDSSVKGHPERTHRSPTGFRSQDGLFDNDVFDDNEAQGLYPERDVTYQAMQEAVVKRTTLEAVEPQECEEFSERYALGRYLGGGETWMMLAASSKGADREQAQRENLAVKIMRWTEEVGREIEVWARMNSMVAEGFVPGFAVFKVLYKCPTRVWDVTPKEHTGVTDGAQPGLGPLWNPSLDEAGNGYTGPYAMILQELTENVESYVNELSEFGVKMLIFQLIHTLYVAWRRLDFQHNNIQMAALRVTALRASDGTVIPAEMLQDQQIKMCFFFAIQGSENPEDDLQCRCMSPGVMQGKLVVLANFDTATLGSCRLSDPKRACMRNEHGLSDLLALSEIIRNIPSAARQSSDLATFDKALVELGLHAPSHGFHGEYSVDVYQPDEEDKWGDRLLGLLQHEYFNDLIPNSWTHFHLRLDPQTCAEASTSEGAIVYGEAITPRDLNIDLESTTAKPTSTWLIPEPVYGHPVRHDSITIPPEMVRLPSGSEIAEKRLTFSRSHCSPRGKNRVGTALFLAAVFAPSSVAT